MTVKLVVLYTLPEDTDAFDRHYFDIHLPLVHQIPGLRRAETGRFIDVLDGGEQTFYRVAELYFPDEAAMDAGLASEAWKATAADYQQLAPPGSRMFVEILDGQAGLLAGA
ncbi:MAG TPA: EthD family reductase [Streptosporangiaceae bacterium]